MRGSRCERWTSWKCFAPGWRNIDFDFGGIAKRSALRNIITNSTVLVNVDRLVAAVLFLGDEDGLSDTLRPSTLMDTRFNLPREHIRRGFSIYVPFILVLVLVC